jgi:hypothetical protein
MPVRFLSDAELARLSGLADDDIAGMLAAYAGWEGGTRRDHRGLVLERLGWRTSAASSCPKAEGSSCLHDTLK